MENGLSRYNGRTIATYTVEDGLASNQVAALFEDREGQLWIGAGNPYTIPAGELAACPATTARASPPSRTGRATTSCSRSSRIAKGICGSVPGITALFSHANIRLSSRLDRSLRYLVVTPDLHRVHHSSHRPETNSNYSAVFPIWDLIFGTFRTRAQQEQMELGLAEVRDQRADRLSWLLVSPLLSRLQRD